MKKLPVLIVFLALLMGSFSSNSQVLSESAKRKVTVGVDIFTDIWLYTNDPTFLPADFRIRTINQGATAVVMYNLQVGQGLSAFSIGLGIRNHNMYSNSIIKDIKADSIIFDKIEPNYKKSKVNTVHLDLPAEFKYRTEGGFKLGIGIKVGYLIDSKEKYKGDRPNEQVMVKSKTKTVRQLEKWSFGPTIRIGFKWVSLFAYYQITQVYVNDRGPIMNPISVGITITPF